MATNKKIASALMLLLCIGFNFKTQAQLKYWVKFNNKNGTPYTLTNPSAFLGPESIHRRTVFNIPYDATDLPVNPGYITQVDNLANVTVVYTSKWLNGVVVSIPSTTVLASINTLTFVNNTTVVNKYHLDLPTPSVQQNNVQQQYNSRTSETLISGTYNYGGSAKQNHELNVDCLHNMGFRGAGILIAVMDVGFRDVDVNPLFDTLRAYNNIRGTRDFVNGGTNVYNSGDHGAEVLSIIAANKPGVIIGSAPMAAYWLLRTEDENSEHIVEEYNWIRGAEFADSVGARILTTSLGYTTFDNSSPGTQTSELDGRTAPMSIAATMAARKGMFVANAAGNEGSNSWHYIGVPADADSICTVGAIDSLSVVAPFSSVGPTFDGRIKPDLVARGWNTWFGKPNGQCEFGNGTSFATPLLAGAVACFMQSHVDYSSMLVLDTLKHTASNASSPNNSRGWGTPNICSFPVGLFEIKADQANFSVFPNPFNTLITIDLNNISYKINSIQLVDIMGKVMATELPKSNTFKINFSTAELPNGVYFVKVNTSAGTMTKKIIK